MGRVQAADEEGKAGVQEEAPCEQRQAGGAPGQVCRLEKILVSLESRKFRSL